MTGELPAQVVTATGDQDTRIWRAEEHCSLCRYQHVLAVNASGTEERLAMVYGDPATAKATAEQIVAEHALATAPYADDEHRGGSWVQLLCSLERENVRLQREIAALRADRP